MIQPEDFLSFARNLYDNLESDDDCVEIRSCISRAYYYVFHLGRNKFYDDARANFDPNDKVKDHENLVNFFYDQRHRDIADRLKKFRRKRNDADYELEMELNKQDAERYLSYASNLEMRINRISVQR